MSRFNKRQKKSIVILGLVAAIGIGCYLYFINKPYITAYNPEDYTVIGETATELVIIASMR